MVLGNKTSERVEFVQEKTGQLFRGTYIVPNIFKVLIYLYMKL